RWSCTPAASWRRSRLARRSSPVGISCLLYPAGDQFSRMEIVFQEPDRIWIAHDRIAVCVEDAGVGRLRREHRDLRRRRRVVLLRHLLPPVLLVLTHPGALLAILTFFFAAILALASFP